MSSLTPTSSFPPPLFSEFESRIQNSLGPVDLASLPSTNYVMDTSDLSPVPEEDDIDNSDHSSGQKKLRTQGPDSSSSISISSNSSSSWISPSGFHFESHSSSSSSDVPVARPKQVVYPDRDIRRLPSDLIGKIFSYLSIQVNGKCAFFAVCKDFNKFSVYMAAREDLDFSFWTAETIYTFLRKLPTCRLVKSISGHVLLDHNLMSLSLRCRKANKFDLADSRITNLDCLSLLPVSYLNIDNCKNISAEALKKGLAPFQNLHTLHALGTNIDDQVVPVLSQNITDIDLTSCQSINPRGLFELGERLNGLSHASLSYTKLNALALGQLSPTLKTLHLYGHSAIETAEFGRYLPRFTTLEKADLRDCPTLGDAGIAALPNTVNSLNISFFDGGDEALPMRSDILAFKLEQLTLTNLNVDDLPFFDDDCFEACSRSSADTLETLTMGGCPNVTSECLARCLSKFVRLKYLHLNDTETNNRVLRNGLPLSLVELNLKDSRNLAPDDYDHLRHLINLEKLWVTRMPLEKVKLLKDAIPDLCILNFQSIHS